MSGASAPPATTGSPSATGPVGDSCPLCHAPLQADQDWCLRCGCAARTRLAPTPNWRAPTIAVAVVMGLSLAVLAAALVYLAGSSNTTKIHVTRTVITQASVTSPGTATTTPAPSATTPAAATPGATTPAATTPGATTPAAATPSASAPAAVGSVVLLPVTPLTSSIVNLNGRINPQGVPTTYQFMYGPTVSYGGLAPLSPTPLGAGTSAVRLAARIANLSPGTTYHYKLTASKAGRAISTADATFTTTR